MPNVIFGSGVVGMVAKEVLVGDWQIVPFRRSRYFSFNPALDDNFVIRDKGIDKLIEDLGGIIQPGFYRRVYSYQGALIKEHSDVVRDLWLQKIFGQDVPPQATAYWTNRLVSPIYSIRVNKFYEALLKKHIETLKAEATKGDITEIGDHYFVRNGVRTDFDNALSTIPLSSLLSLMGVSHQLKSLPVHYYHVQASRVDLEGANQALVVDRAIDFYKVTNIAPQRYLIYGTHDIPSPGAYFLSIIGPGEIIDGTQVRDTVPIGPMPDLTEIENRGIFCVGSAAQHDWCADVGSNFLRLVRYAQRGYKPA